MRNIGGKYEYRKGIAVKLLIGYCFLLFLQNQDVGAQTYNTQLFDHLFANYNSAVRPYCGNNDQISVRLDVAIRQIVDLHEPTQILTLNLWVRMAWSDCQLSWDSAAFANITSLVVPFKYLWIPDLTLYDSTADDFPGYDDYRPAIYSDGSVYYNFPTIIQSRCLVDVEKFPYDSQTCSLTFGSWAFHGYEMDLVYKNPYGDLSSAVENVEWNITSFTAERHVLYYGCCPEPYPDVTYYLHITRKPQFYIVNIIIPTFLITGMAILGFFLPSESGEKVSLQITVMLALAVFQLLVADSLPPSADTTPLIAIYFNFCLFLVGFACVMAVVVLSIHYEIHGTMPRWVVVIFLKGLAKGLFVKVPPFEDPPDENRNYSKANNAPTTPTQKLGRVNKIAVLQATKENVLDDVDINNEKEERKGRNTNVYVKPHHWRALATVIDKLSCIIFLIIGIIGTVIVFRQFN